MREPSSAAATTFLGGFILVPATTRGSETAPVAVVTVALEIGCLVFGCYSCWDYFGCFHLRERCLIGNSGVLVS